MYVRQIVTLVVGLYTSRLVFQLLGVSDFGLYGVVGGILTMFSFMSMSLGTTTSRFLNAEMGKRDGNVNKIFNVNVMLHAGLAVLVLFLSESLGLWYVLHCLKVEPGKLTDTIFVFEVCVFTACLGIVNLPYRSVFASHERFKFLAVLDIFNTFLRLGGVLLLEVVDAHHALRFYAVVMSVSAVSSFFVYHWCSYRCWHDIVRWRKVIDRASYRQVLEFGNWNLLSMFSRVLRCTGADLLFNSFFGTFINGAYSISRTVANNVASFSENIEGVASPQIIQAYSAHDLVKYSAVVVLICKLCLLVFFMLFFPLYLELEYILQLWLGEVPYEAVVFTKWQLLLLCVSISSSGVNAAINATGRIKWFSLSQVLFDAISILLGYLILYFHYPAACILMLFVAADVLYRMLQLYLASRLLHFDAFAFVSKAYFRPFLVACMMSGIMIGYGFLDVQGGLMKCLGIVGCLLLTIILCCWVGMTNVERKSFLSFVLKR